MEEIKIAGKNIFLKTPDIKEYRAFKRKYIPDPISDPKPFVYKEEEIDAEYEKLDADSEWNRILGIFTRQGEIIGIMIFKRIVFSEKRSDYEIILANETYRDRGVGTEATILSSVFAKDTLGLTRVYSEVPENNVRMAKMLEKSGFSITKKRKDFKGNIFNLFVKRYD